MAGLQKVYPAAGELAERLESSYIELKDISQELSLIHISAEADTRATYEVLMSQLDRYPELQNDVAFLSDYSSFNKNVDFAGRMVRCV